MQTKWLVSIYYATLGWNGLKEREWKCKKKRDIITKRIELEEEMKGDEKYRHMVPFNICF